MQALSCYLDVLKCRRMAPGPFPLKNAMKLKQQQLTLVILGCMLLLKALFQVPIRVLSLLGFF